MNSQQEGLGSNKTIYPMSFSVEEVRKSTRIGASGGGAGAGGMYIPRT